MEWLQQKIGYLGTALSTVLMNLVGGGFYLHDKRLKVATINIILLVHQGIR